MNILVLDPKGSLSFYTYICIYMYVTYSFSILSPLCHLLSMCRTQQALKINNVEACPLRYLKAQNFCAWALWLWLWACRCLLPRLKYKRTLAQSVDICLLD